MIDTGGVGRAQTTEGCTILRQESLDCRRKTSREQKPKSEAGSYFLPWLLLLLLLEFLP